MTGWRCCRCGSSILVEVSASARVKTRVDGVDGDGKLLFGRHESVEPGTPSGYECGCCGETLTDGGVRVAGRKAAAALLCRYRQAGPPVAD